MHRYLHATFIHPVPVDIYMLRSVSNNIALLIVHLVDRNTPTSGLYIMTLELHLRTGPTSTACVGDNIKTHPISVLLCIQDLRASPKGVIVTVFPAVPGYKTEQEKLRQAI